MTVRIISPCYGNCPVYLSLYKVKSFHVYILTAQTPRSTFRQALESNELFYGRNSRSSVKAV